MAEMIPCIRRDLDFIPVQQGDRKWVVIRDQSGIIPEDKVMDFSVFQFMALLDGTRTLRDLQMELMRRRGGSQVASEEIPSFMALFDGKGLCDSPGYGKERFHPYRTSEKGGSRHRGRK